jgi:hypothetical protein
MSDHGLSWLTISKGHVVFDGTNRYGWPQNVKEGLLLQTGQPFRYAGRVAAGASGWTLDQPLAPKHLPAKNDAAN